MNQIDTEQSISNLSTANFNLKKHSSFSEGDNEISFNITPEEDEIKKDIKKISHPESPRHEIQKKLKAEENFKVTNFQSKFW
jgi:hypothetical protein